MTQKKTEIAVTDPERGRVPLCTVKFGHNLTYQFYNFFVAVERYVPEKTPVVSFADRELSDRLTQKMLFLKAGDVVKEFYRESAHSLLGDGSDLPFADRPRSRRTILRDQEAVIEQAVLAREQRVTLPKLLR